MSKNWFDPQTGLLTLDEHVAEMPSYQKVIQDDLIETEELRLQAERVTALFRQLDEKLSPELKAIVTEGLCELAVLYALQRKQAMQER